jgi:hypothetical protein
LSDETSQTLCLFDEAPAAPAADEPAVDRWATVAIAGVRIDFREPSAPRIAAQTIFALGAHARLAARDLVPVNFKDFVMDLVERADYNVGRADAAEMGKARK